MYTLQHYPRYAVGDKVKGLFSQKDKTGIVIDPMSNSHFIRVQWDEGQKPSRVRKCNVEPVVSSVDLPVEESLIVTVYLKTQADSQRILALLDWLKQH